MKGYNLTVMLAGALVLAASAELRAQNSEPPRPLVVTAENLMAGDARHQEYEARGGDPEALLPGDVIVYRLRFTNQRPDSVRQVVFQNAVPAGLEYVAGSAGADRTDVTVEFSVDGGATYSDAPQTEVMVDGRPETRPAPPETYTHIRWTLSGWLQPQQELTAEYRARLPGDEGGSDERPPETAGAEDVGA